MIRPGVTIAAGLMAAGGVCMPLGAQSLDIETGLDILQDPATKIEGLHRFYAGVDLGRELTFGQAIYSGAVGDAGGAFFWGFEGVKRFGLTPDLALGVSGFFGGGGGAAQVIGDGTMFRFGAFAEHAIARDWALQAGVSRVMISDADIDDWAATFGLAYRPSDARREGGSGGLRLRSVSMGASRYSFPDGTTRAGGAQPDLSLVGAEASFFAGPKMEFFLGADGAASGGDGYMQVFGGARRRFDLGAVSLFGQASAGFGGGGEVDTGSGPLARAALGISVPLGDMFDAELSYGVYKAVDSGLEGSGVQARLTRVFHRTPDAVSDPNPQNWQLSMGLSGQVPNGSYMKSGSNDGIDPIMQESAIDLFITDSAYVTGNAQTTVGGGVAGFAIGLIGLGYEFDLSETWRVSVEGHVGAAGGGGVDVGKGLMGGLRAELDYVLSPRNSLSLGVGTLQAVDGGGLNVPVIQIGFKHRFTTY